MKHARHTTIINGLNTTYYQLGHGKPLLFLHGGRVRARTFKRLLALLSEKYTVIAPDVPGYGSSDTPAAAWSYADYATFFDAFLSRLDIENVTVIGYSMGGGIALNLAAVSKRISRLILVDASGIRYTRTKRSHHDLRRLLFYITRPYYARALTVLLRDYAQYIWKHRNDRAHMQQIRRACFDTSYGNALRHITVPTQLVWGDNDRIYPPLVAHEFQKHIPQATLEMVQGNHDWPVYNPLLFRRFIL